MTRQKLVIVFLLYLVFEIGVWSFALSYLPAANNRLIGMVLTGCGTALLGLYLVVAFPHAAPAGAAATSGAAGELWKHVPREAKGLPLYLLVGPKGSGKTSLVMASAWTPRLLAGQVNEGGTVVPTGGANVWLVGGALVIELGELFRASESEVRRKLLKSIADDLQTRLEGVILCCDVGAFLGIPDAPVQAALASQAAGQLQAVRDILGAEFPVYVVFSKADSIPYFGEYFGRLSDLEREQALGCNLPPAGKDLPDAAVGDALTERIGSALNELCARLADHRLVFLKREQERVNKAGIYEFPREVRRIRGTLLQFLRAVFDPAATGAPGTGTMLRGFYFTGVTPRDQRRAFASNLFRQIGMPAARPRQNLSPQTKPSHAWLWAAMSGLAMAAILLFGYSGWQNRSLLAATGQAAAECDVLRPGARLKPENLQQIDRLRQQVETLTAYHNLHPSPLLRFGLYAGDEVLASAQKIYFKRIGQYFLNNIMTFLQTEFAALPREPQPAHSLPVIQAHLMVYETIAGSRTAADPSFPDWLLLVWRDGPGWRAEGDRIAQANFTFLGRQLRRGPRPRELDFRADARAVEQAKAYLDAAGKR